MAIRIYASWRLKIMHKHLTFTDRLKIEKGLKEGLNPCQIAKRLHVCHTTIYRELKRGQYMHLNSDYTTELRYSPDISHQRYRNNLSAKGADLKIGNDIELINFIENKILNEKYSPAAVVAEIKEKGLIFKTTICEKTIYNYIDKGVFFSLTRKNLPEHGERKRKYQEIVENKAALPPKGESIEKRPKEVSDRSTFGHWEGDCVCGKKKTKETLFTLTERLTREEIIVKIPSKSVACILAAINNLESKYGKKFSKIFKSITFDNGAVYYCHPYSAYERGTNENMNKMIRRFLPKGTDFRKITTEYIEQVEKWLNNYPREILGFKTPEYLFQKELANIA